MNPDIGFAEYYTPVFMAVPEPASALFEAEVLRVMRDGNVSTHQVIQELEVDFRDSNNLTKIGDR